MIKKVHTRTIYSNCALTCFSTENTSPQQPVYYHNVVDEQDAKKPQEQVTRDPIVAPLCPTAPPEDTSYSWALVSSSAPPAPEIGFTFHKPSSQRFLDGQPRTRRRRSTKQNVLSPNTTSTISPPSQPASSIGEPMDMQFEYLTEQLELLSQDTNTFHPEEDLTAILNNVLSEPPVPPINRSQCGSFVPNPTCCQSKNPGESVIITITPLAQDNTSATSTRIVTCYCGQNCTCPGCLVHPGNFFLGNDPYAGPSSSSSCYGSDEEYSLNFVNK